MAVVVVTTKMGAGVLYTHTTDSSVDWPSVPNDTYFYDLNTELVNYKDADGIIIGAYDAQALTDVVTDGSTITGNGTANDPLVAINGGSSTGTQLLSGFASYSGTGLVFDVSNLTYIIDGNNYSSTAVSVTFLIGSSLLLFE